MVKLPSQLGRDSLKHATGPQRDKRKDASLNDSFEKWQSPPNPATVAFLLLKKQSVIRIKMVVNRNPRLPHGSQALAQTSSEQASDALCELGAPMLPQVQASLIADISSQHQVCRLNNRCPLHELLSRLGSMS